MATLTQTKLPSRDELTRLGESARAFYEPMRVELEKNHWDEYLVIHPENGDYIISPNHREAVALMRARYAGVIFHTIRIGYRAFAHFGGRGATDGKRP